MLSANSSLPFISGRSKSTMRHVSAFGIALAISALGRSKARTLKPAFGSISTEHVERRVVVHDYDRWGLACSY
jgi:hypothetical protein